MCITDYHQLEFFCNTNDICILPELVTLMCMFALQRASTKILPVVYFLLAANVQNYVQQSTGTFFTADVSASSVFDDFYHCHRLDCFFLTGNNIKKLAFMISVKYDVGTNMT